MKNYGVTIKKPKPGTPERIVLDLLDTGASFLRPPVELTQEQISKAIYNLRTGNYEPEEE